MLNENFKIIVSHGDWLETMLTKDNTWQLKRQFQEVISLLGLDYELPENDLSLRLIDKIETENLRDFYLNKIATLDVTGEKWSITKKTFEGEDAAVIVDFLKHEWETTYNKQPKYELLEKVFISVMNMYHIRKDALVWFGGLLKGDVPWGFREEMPLGINHFVNCYNGIRTQLDFNKRDGFHAVKVFTDDYPQVKIGIPTDVILCNILLDFFIAGGRYYYGFCDHCKRFYVSRRKQKKHFCSDICRALNYKLEAPKKKNL